MLPFLLFNLPDICSLDIHVKCVCFTLKTHFLFVFLKASDKIPFWSNWRHATHAGLYWTWTSLTYKHDVHLAQLKSEGDFILKNAAPKIIIVAIAISGTLAPLQHLRPELQSVKDILPKNKPWGCLGWNWAIRALAWESLKGVQDVSSSLSFDGFEWSFTPGTEVIHYVPFRAECVCFCVSLFVSVRSVLRAQEEHWW